MNEFQRHLRKYMHEEGHDVDTFQQNDLVACEMSLAIRYKYVRLVSYV